MDARNPELEAPLLANPFDTDAWAVFVDWLQVQGDPRGQLAALMDGGKPIDAMTLLTTRADYFLGDFLVDHQRVHDEGYNNASSHLRTPDETTAWDLTQKQAFLWSHGFIRRIRVSHDMYSDEAYKGETADILAAAFAHPSGRYVTELAFQSNGDPSDDNLQSLIDVIGKSAPATIRKITFGDNVDQISWHKTGNLGAMWAAVPNLRVLEIETGELEVGDMVAPRLERFRLITGGLTQTCGLAIATARMPEIQHLEIYYGDENYGATCTVDDVKPLLARTDLPKLRYLGLENSEFANDLARAVAEGGPLIAQLTTLDLAFGTMTDEGAEALAAGRAHLAHLECLDLTRNFLSAAGIAAVQGICKRVVTDEQETPLDSDGGYFVDISE